MVQPHAQKDLKDFLAAKPARIQDLVDAELAHMNPAHRAQVEAHSFAHLVPKAVFL